MKHFCHNPECHCFNYPSEPDTIMIHDGSNGDYKSVKRVLYIDHNKEKGYEKLYFCSVCMGVLDLLKISI